MNKAATFRGDLLASTLGQGWMVSLSFIFIPIYIKLLGLEGYGLVAFWITIQAIIQVFDFGLTASINREMARGVAQSSSVGELKVRAFTIQITYVLIGVLLAIFLFVTRDLIADYWIEPAQLSKAEVQAAVYLIFTVILLQWPINIFYSGLMGLSRQKTVVLMSAVFASINHFGAVVSLILFERSTVTYFSWIVFVSVVQLFIVGGIFWNSFPRDRERLRFDWQVLKETRSFMSGMLVINAASIVLTSIDKLLLSRILPLDHFARYSVAGSLGRGPFVLISPIFNVIYPRFSSYAAAKDEYELKTLYHKATQILAVLVFPLSLTLAIFSNQVVFAWIGNLRLAAEIAPIVSVLVIGTTLNGLLNVSHALQLAHGYLRMAVLLNISLAALTALLVFWWGNAYGAFGASVAWPIINAIYMLVSIPVTHHLILRGGLRHWAIVDIGVPLLSSSIVVAGAYLLLPVSCSRVVTGTAVLSTLLFAWIAAAFAAPTTRQVLVSALRKR